MLYNGENHFSHGYHMIGSDSESNQVTRKLSIINHDPKGYERTFSPP